RSSVVDCGRASYDRDTKASSFTVKDAPADAGTWGKSLPHMPGLRETLQGRTGEGRIAQIVAGKVAAQDTAIRAERVECILELAHRAFHWQRQGGETAERCGRRATTSAPNSLTSRAMCRQAAPCHPVTPGAVRDSTAVAICSVSMKARAE